MKELASRLSVSDLKQQLRVGADFSTKDECQKCAQALSQAR